MTDTGVQTMGMSTAVAPRKNGNGHPPEAHALMERVVIKGDLSQLTEPERVKYYGAVCASVGLNPLTQPFAYITLNNKLTLYALRNCTDQLRTIHDVSVLEMAESERDGVFIVTCKVKNAAGRTDMAKGAVNIASLKGEALANAMMKAETKAKRRATLSLCGLGFLDETEIEDIPAQTKTLPKKDARDVYTKLQAEIDGFKSERELRTWGEAAKERIAVLPIDWQDILRLRYQERLVDLRQHPPKKEEHDPQTGEIVDDKALPEVDRLLSWIDALLSGAKKADDLEIIWEHQVSPKLIGVFPPDQEKALAIYQKHELRFENAQ